jgi:hypothetical protein
MSAHISNTQQTICVYTCTIHTYTTLITAAATTIIVTQKYLRTSCYFLIDPEKLPYSTFYDYHSMHFALKLMLCFENPTKVSFSDGVATRVHAPPFYTRYVTRVFKTGAVPPQKIGPRVVYPWIFHRLIFFPISTWWQYVPNLETNYRCK